MMRNLLTIAVAGFLALGVTVSASSQTATAQCNGAISQIQFQYLVLPEGDCDVTNPQGGDASCTGENLTDGSVAVVVLTRPWALQVIPDQDIDPGDTFTMQSRYSDDWFDATTSFIAVEWYGAYSQTVAFRTDCEQPPNLGDRFGNFVVVGLVIVSPEELVEKLVETVISLNVRHGISNSLDAKLDTVMACLDDMNESNDAAAVNSLYAFINAVEAQRGKAILNEDADALIAKALSIIDALQRE